MNLTDYPTPETDALLLKLGVPTCTGDYEMLTLVRNLEQRLAMCRDSLKQIAAFKTMKSHDAGRVISEDAKDIAIEAIAATEPKR